MQGFPSAQGFQQGPADGRRNHSLVEGLQPVSRIGECVVNCSVDAKRFQELPPRTTRGDYDPADPEPNKTVDNPPHYHEWSTCLPGMLLLSKKEQSNNVTAHMSSEKGLEVISCNYGILPKDADKYFFAGVTRSKMVQPIDDGAGPMVDEFFTAAVQGMAVVLNNSNEAVYPGDELIWSVDMNRYPAELNAGRRGLGNTYPRRVTIERLRSDGNSSRKIGRALTHAKPNEAFDLLISCV